jgi:hypothetical protein
MGEQAEQFVWRTFSPHFVWRWALDFGGAAPGLKMGAEYFGSLLELWDRF